jgi:hypothetical protein
MCSGSMLTTEQGTMNQQNVSKSIYWPFTKIIFYAIGGPHWGKNPNYVHLLNILFWCTQIWEKTNSLFFLQNPNIRSDFHFRAKLKSYDPI